MWAVAAPAAALAIAAVANCTPAQAGHAPKANVPTPSVSQRQGIDPPDIVIASAANWVGAPTLRMISPTTGRVVKTLPPLSPGNGLALAPDSKSVYVVGVLNPVKGPIVVRRISVSTGRVSVVADGAYPAVSPDSAELAYATGREFTDLAIMNLRTGRDRVINLEPLIGKKGTLLNGSRVTWLGDGDQVVVLPGQVISTFSRLSAFSRPSAGRQDQVSAGERSSRTCPSAYGASSLCLIVVDVGPDRLAAHRIFIPVRFNQVPDVVSGDLSARHSFIAAEMGWTSPGAIDEVTLSGSGVVVHQIATVPTRAIPEAAAPGGDRILYLMGRTPSLWIATILDGRLTRQHRLLTDSRQFEYGAAAW
jgi:hypothetical protein